VRTVSLAMLQGAPVSKAPGARRPGVDVVSMLAMMATAVVGFAAAAEAVPPLPDDPRLQPIRDHLSQIIQSAEAAGLPSDVIVSKVREGLAKGVAPARIEAVTVRLAQHLEAAQRYVIARRPGGSRLALVRAVAEARMAGVGMPAIDSLVSGDRPEIPHAVEVVTDLSLRGYPSGRAGVVVQNVLSRDVRSLGGVAGTLETVRQDCGLTHVEAVDALARGLASSDSLQNAYKETIEDEGRRRHRSASSSEWGGDSPGRSGLAPGRLKFRGVPPGRNR